MAEYNAPLGNESFVIDLPGATVRMKVQSDDSLVRVMSARPVQLKRTLMDRVRGVRTVRWTGAVNVRGGIAVASKTGDATATGPGARATTGISYGDEHLQSDGSGNDVTVVFPEGFEDIIVRAADVLVDLPELTRFIDDQR